MTQRRNPLLATLLALMLVFSLGSPALAAATEGSIEPTLAGADSSDTSTQLKVTAEEATKTAMKLFSIPERLGKPDISLWNHYSNNRPVWNLSWESDPRLGGTRVTYSVGISAETGEPISYYVYQYDPSGYQPSANYTRDEAQKIADEWYAKLVSADKVTQPQTDPYLNNELSFSWIRLVNGIPFPDNTISITINPSDGTLSEFYCNWDDKLTFPVPEGVISIESAQAALEKVGGLELVYQRIHTPAGRSEIRLVYVNKAQNAYVNALTGQVVDYNGQPWIEEGNPIDLGASDVELVKLPQPLTRDEALALARKYLGEETKGEPTYESYSEPGQSAARYDDGIRVSTWSFSWDLQSQDPDQYRYRSATIDLDHGVLLSMYRYDGYPTDEQLRDKTPVSEEVARATAIDFLKQVRPDLIKHLSITDRSVLETYPDWPADRQPPIQREYYFTFRRIVNGLRFDADSVTISVNRFTGEVTDFYVYWSEVEFPNPAEVQLTPEEAMVAFQTESPLQLTYLRSYVPYSDGEQRVHLVYRPYNVYGGSLIDPMTGHLLDYSGRDLTELRRGAEDIADHPAKRYIELMINRGVFEVKDGQFNPDLTMTRGDVAKALIIAFNQGYVAEEYNRLAAKGTAGGAPAPTYADVNYDNGYFGYVEAAVRAGILIPKYAGEKLNPDEVVTHEELALLTARAMGYAKIIAMKNIITNNYTDGAAIGADYVNAVGLLAGLEVLSNEGAFEPQSQVTRAYAAEVIAKATQKAQRNYYYY